MPRNAAITIRLPASLKKQLQARAESEHRSLSAQVVADLERLAEEPARPVAAQGRFLGIFASTATPSDEDVAVARRLLWRRLRADG